MRYALTDKHRFSVFDAEEGLLFWGCDQEWYRNRWQRMAGCGPCVVSTILLYLLKEEFPDSAFPIPKALCLAHMEEIWKSVTPTRHGIPTTALLLSGIELWARRRGRKYCAHTLDVAKLPVSPFAASCAASAQSRGDSSNRRCTMAEAVSFLREALEKNLPVAFLNLDAGKEPALDNWHWVTVIAMDCPSEHEALLTILDEGEEKAADLGLWLESTKGGGGFLWFSLL